MAATSTPKAAVGQQYLVGAGVPDSDIIAETESTSTDQSVRRLAVIARTNNLQRIVVVSDATHLFRIHQICAANGLNVLTSPRPRVPIEGPTGETERIEHEILSYTLWLPPPRLASRRSRAFCQNLLSIIRDCVLLPTGKLLSRNSSLQYPAMPPFPILSVTVARTL